MNTKLIAILLSFLAAICFLISYFIERETPKLLLGITWLIIAILNFTSYKKDKQRWKSILSDQVVQEKQHLQKL